MKTCFKCNKEKPLVEFYKHKAMADGYLGKCKDCTKSDVHANYLIKLQDPQWVEKELSRHREKARKYRERFRTENLSSFASNELYSIQRKTRQPSSPESILLARKNWVKRNKEKRKAHIIVGNAIRSGRLVKEPCQICGEMKSEAHHEDYSRPLYVTWLCKKHHHERHNELRKLERLSKALLQLE